ncbi:hypothetical protein Tco_1548681 [Tanacetum coccineum]
MSTKKSSYSWNHHIEKNYDDEVQGDLRKKNNIDEYLQLHISYNDNIFQQNDRLMLIKEVKGILSQNIMVIPENNEKVVVVVRPVSVGICGSESISAILKEPQAHSYMMEADYTYQSRLTRTEGCPIVGFERRSFESRPTRRSTKPVSNELPESSSARVGNTRYIRSDLPQSNYIRSEEFSVYRNETGKVLEQRAVALRRHPNAYLWKANGFEGQAKALHRLANELIQRAVALHR